MQTRVKVVNEGDGTSAPAAWSFARGLVEGLERPSPVGLLGALAIVAVVILAAAMLLTEERVASLPEGALMVTPSDDCGRLLPLVMRGAAAQGTNPIVWILGASDTREMLCTERELNGLLQGSPAVGRVVLLCADAQLLEERAALVEKLHPGPAGAIVHGINLRQFCRPRSVLVDRAERYRLGFRSASFDEEMARAGVAMPPVTGHYFLDNHLFFLWRVECLAPWKDDPAYRAHRTHARGEPRRNPRGEQIPFRFSSEDFDRSAGVLSRLVDRNRRAGGPPVMLLEIPSVESVEPGHGGRNDAANLKLYRAAVRGWAEREGLVLLDPGASVRLGRKDFGDMAHLGDDEARRRFSIEFLRQLTAHREGGRP